MSAQETAGQPAPRRRLGRGARLLLGLLVSAGFLGLTWWSLSSRGVTLEEVGGRLAQGHWQGIATYVLVLFFLAALRVVRWGVLLRGIGHVGWRKITGVALVGQMAIGLLPMRLGEAVRPLLIVEPGQIDLGQATATVMVERVLDGILLGALFAITLVLLHGMTLPPELAVGAWVSTLAFGGLGLLMLAATLFRERAVRLLWRMILPFSPRLAGRVVGVLESFLGALRAIARGWRATLAFLVWTLILWAVTGLSLLPIFQAYDLDLGVTASLAVICAMVLGFMIPAGPAATGTLNYAIILALGAFGVDDAVNGALALLLFVLLLVVNALSGLIGLLVGGFSVTAVVQAGIRPSVPTGETSGAPRM